MQLLAGGLGQLPELEVNPTFNVVNGLSDMSKSCFCQKLAERLPFVILESDVPRKILFSTTGSCVAESSRLFGAVCQFIERLLQKGASHSGRHQFIGKVSGAGLCE